MLGALSAIGSIFSFLGAALKAAFGFAIYRSGENKQAQKDIAANEDVIRKQRDDAAALGPSNPALDRERL